MPLIPEYIEGRVFTELCSHCPYAKECHENAETCDEYNDLCHFYMKEIDEARHKQMLEALKNNSISVIKKEEK